MTARIRASRRAGVALRLRIGLGRDLPVDAPYVVGLRMDEDLAAGVPRRVEEESPLGGERQRGVDIGDQEAILEGVARESDADRMAHRRMRTVGPDRVFGSGGHAVGKGERDALAVLGETGELVAPTGDDAELGEACDEELLDLGLADVHERREVVVGAAGERHAEQLTSTEVRAPDSPLDPAVGDPLPDPEPIPDLERLALHAERPAAPGDMRRRGVVEGDLHAVLRQPAGERQPDRPGPDDRDLSPGGRSRPRGRAPRSRSVDGRCRRARPRCAAR